MLDRIVDDVNKALDNNAYIAGLSLALTLPDICGKAEYGPDVGSKKRYIDWYDTYIPFGFSPFHGMGNPNQTPELTGEVLYSLRCTLLHEGNPNVDKDKIRCENNKVDHFTLVLEDKKGNGLYFQSVSRGKDHRSMAINVRGICKFLTETAKAYYKKYPEKFNFFQYSIREIHHDTEGRE